MARLYMAAAFAAVFLFAAAVSADWKSAGSSITSVASGGIILYLTESNGKLVLAKTLKASSEIDPSKPPKPRQSVVMSGNWPSGVFQLSINGYSIIVDNSGMALKLDQSGATPANFVWDVQSRLNVGGFCLDVVSLTVNGKVKLSPCDDMAMTQKWSFGPSKFSSPANFKSLIVSLNPANSQPMCLDATGTTTAGMDGNMYMVKPAPVLSPCNPTNPGQLFKIRGVTHPVDLVVDPFHKSKYYSGYPNGAFDILYEPAGLCLVTNDPQYLQNMGRAPVTMGFANCNFGSVLPSATQSFFSFWNYNSRSQIQSDLLVYGTGGSYTLPICLDDKDGTVGPSDCSLKSTHNRFMLVEPTSIAWPS